MGNVNRGKDFEERFKKDWEKSFPQTLCLRLKDNTSGYKTVSQNPCDFICFENKKLFMVEVKSLYGNNFNFKEKLRQYDNLVSYMNIPDVYPCVIVWFIDFDKVLFAPIETIKAMVDSGVKSIKIKDYENYGIKEIPSKKLRVFMESDYTVLDKFVV